MFSVSVEFLHGTFRGDPGGVANTGRMERGEWPPSPARLFAAFVAADGTGVNCRVTDGSELGWLEALPRPKIRAVSHVHHQPLRQRYVVRHKHTAEKATHQEYIGRSGALVRPGVRLVPRDPRVVYEWAEQAPALVLEALARRAARIGYLGTSDSPVRVAVASGLPPAGPDENFVPDPGGQQTIAVTRRGDLETLDRMYVQWCERGASISRSQFPALRHEERYRSPEQPHAVDRGKVAVWLCLANAVSGRRISAVTTLFKQALLKRYMGLYGEPPPILHGHGFSGTGYEIARYLALPDVGSQWSRGRLHGLALWLPPGTESTIRRRVHDAATDIRRLVGHGLDMLVLARDEQERLWARNPERWCRPSLCWVTAVPAIHERRRPIDLDEVGRWCRHAGLPGPTAFRSSRTPFVPGALDLAPVEVNRPGKPGLPYSHVKLHFDEPVSGPVVVGAGRQRGFGLCIPLQDDE